ncbi:DUF3618 domain-containing protein [Brevibacterium yomogidense]|uniref:DUF3618 domain-containing protein n=1 Tax=Brevibacterium yomogidense TaxID=946573 RepID=UPI0018DF4681|nr:DUF3618 domain-containing protein [Brevibacterium yomogidense]
MTHPHDPHHPYPTDPTLQPSPGYQPPDNPEKSPKEIRTEIERTRRNLGYDVDAMAEKVSPARAAERQRRRISDTVSSWKDTVMGSAEDAGSDLQSRGHHAAENVHGMADSVSDAARSGAESVRAAAEQFPEQVTQRTRGNPLAVGVIALGAGWLIGSLIPSSRQEQQLATQAKEVAQPYLDEAQQVAKDMGQNLREPAQEAVQSVREQAQSGAENVRSEAQEESGHLKSEAQTSGEAVQQARR